MLHEALVTVIMPVHNGGRFLRSAVASLLAQTYEDFAAIIVDDGSTDRTPAILAELTDPRVRIVRNDKGAGPAGARNIALDLVRSTYIAFFDSDDVTHPDRLEKQMAFLAAHPDVGLLASRVNVVDENEAEVAPVWGHVGDAEVIAPTLLFRNCLATSTIVVDRRVLGAERFDATLPVASDYDMWSRIVGRTKTVCMQDPLVSYRIHPSNLTHTHAVQTEACLETIVRRAVARFCVDVTTAELQLHRRIGSRHLDGTDCCLSAVGAWLAKLAHANRTTGVYSSAPFRRVLAMEWMDACEVAARTRGADVWPRIAGSEITRLILSDVAVWRRLARIAWYSLRASVRRAIRRSAAAAVTD